MHRVKFSLYINPQTTGPENDLAVINAAVEQILYADQHGFSTVFLTEHHLTGYNAFSDPLLFAAYLAPQLQNLAVGFSVAVLALHHPLRFATQCSLLDNLLKGRFIAGVGTGGGPTEFAGFGRSVADRTGLMSEALDAVLGCWQGDYEHHGKFFDFSLKGLRVIPTPYTKPHPTIARAATSMESVDDTARRGWPIILGRFPEERIREYVARYRNGMVAAGHPEDLIARRMGEITMLKIVFLADTDEQARRDLEQPITRYLVQSALANAADYISEQQAQEQAEAFVERAVLVGSPRTVADRIRAYGDAGITNMMIWTYFGEMDPALTMRTMQLFSEQVMPLVHSEPSPA